MTNEPLKTKEQECERLQNAIKEVRKIAKGHDYWSSNLRMATDVIYEIIDKCDEILGDNN